MPLTGTELQDIDVVASVLNDTDLLYVVVDPSGTPTAKELPGSVLNNKFLTQVADDTTPQLGGELDANSNNITNLSDVTFRSGAQGGTIRTGTSNADKFVLQAYDINSGVYRTLIEADTGNTPFLQLISDYLRLEDDADPTKIVKFDVTGVTTGTTRTLTVPDASGTPLLDGDIGSTVQAQIAQQAHIADADGTIADITAKFNTLLSYLENFGFIATS